MKPFFLALIVPLAFAACSSTHGGSTATAPGVATVGLPAPAFRESTANGTMLSMRQLRGRPVYLNFFATWCTPCNDEAPDINAVARRFKARGLQVVGVDVLENAAKARDFIRQHRLIYPAVVDTGALRAAYEINGMPVHVFIDRRGIVRKIEIGELSRAQMIADVRTIL